jgi:hypothetical protein
MLLALIERLTAHRTLGRTSRLNIREAVNRIPRQNDARPRSEGYAVGSVMLLRDQNARGEVLVLAAQDTGSRTASINSTVRVSYTSI